MTKFILFFFIFFSVNSYAQWNTVFSGETTPFNGSYTLNPTTAYVVADYGKCYKTTNSGFSWFPNNPGNSYTLYSIAFVNDLNGIITASNGRYFLTDNGGTSWGEYNTGSVFPVYSVKYWNANKFAMCGDTGMIRVYTNGGLSGQYNGTKGFHSVTFLDSMNILAVGLYGAVTKSTNSGVSFINLNSGTANNLYSVSFVNNLTGFAAGSYGTIIKTTNGGNNWVSQTSGTNLWLYGISFTSANSGYVCGEQGKLMKTVNGGTTWVSQVSNSVQELRSIAVRTDNLGYCVGVNGTVLKTTNGGATFINQTSSDIPEKYYISQNFPNPFNPDTKINFAVKESSIVRIDVYNSQGKVTATLTDQRMQPGSYNVVFDGSALSSGTYKYRMTLNGITADTKRMIFLK